MKYITEAIRVFFKKDNFIYFFKIQAFLLPLAFVSVVWSLILAFKAESLAESLSTNPIFIFSSVALNLLNAVIYLFVAVASIEAIRRVLENSCIILKEDTESASAVWEKITSPAFKSFSYKRINANPCKHKRYECCKGESREIRSAWNLQYIVEEIAVCPALPLNPEGYKNIDFTIPHPIEQIVNGQNGIYDLILLQTVWFKIWLHNIPVVKLKLVELSIHIV